MDFVAKLEIPPDQTTWRGDEIPLLTAGALCQVPDAPPFHVTELLRIEHTDGKEVWHPLSDTDREALEHHWRECGLPSIAGPLTLEQWPPYLEAFNEEPRRPPWATWTLGAVPPRDPWHDARVGRQIVLDQHRERLMQAIRDGEVVARLPGSLIEAAPSTVLQNVVLTKSELRKFATLLCIEVTESRTEGESISDPVPGVEWLTWQEAQDWMNEATGETWPLPRLVASAVRLGVWLEPRPDQPALELQHVFQGRWQGFMAEIGEGYDRKRLGADRVKGVISVTTRPDGTPLRFTPPLKFSAQEIKVWADDLKLLVAAVRRGVYPERAQPVVLHAGSVDIVPDDPGLAAWIALHGGPSSLAGAKVEPLRFVQLPISLPTGAPASGRDNGGLEPLRFPLVTTLERWFSTNLDGLPANLGAALRRATFPLTWDELSPEQRAAWASQYDAQHDPAREEERMRVWNYWTRRDELLDEQRAVEAMNADKPSEHIAQRRELSRIARELAELDAENALAAQRGPAGTAQRSAEASLRSVPAQRLQENVILAKLRELNFEPTRLPKNEPGKPGAKAKVKKALGTQGMWAQSTVFSKAWERLRAAGDIADAE